MKHRLSLERIEQAARVIDPVFLRTPQFVSEPLSEQLGVRLAVKLETLNPIRSFKGRGADFLASQATPGVRLICASAGNFGLAMAYACRKRQLGLTVYAGRRANPATIERIRTLGADAVLHGADFDEAKLEAKRAALADRGGARFVEDGRDIETLEGAGTMGLEWLEFPHPLEVLLIPLGNGAMFNGVARVLKARSPKTRIIAVQAAGAPAMVESWRAGRVIVHDHLRTIADGIAVRVPIPEALEDMKGLIDEAILVREDSIIPAMRLLQQHIGVVAEPSGAVGIAALLEQPKLFNGRLVGTIVSGGNVSVEQMQAWFYC